MSGQSTAKKLINYLFFAIEFAGLISLIVTGKYVLTGVIIGNVLFWVIYLFIEAKMDWKLPIYIRLLIILSIISNGVLGVALNLYHNPKTPLFDQIQHTFACYAVSIWLYYILQQVSGVIFTKKIMHVVIILCFALALGACYEMCEFAVDHIIKSKTKNQDSLYDTDLDLISNLIGGIIASLHFVFSSRLNTFLIQLKQKDL